MRNEIASRRRFVAAIAVALSSARIARADPVRKIYRIGFLTYGGPDLSLLVEAFKRRMRELGYVEGQSFTLHYLRPATSDGLPGAADDLVRRNVHVIVAVGTHAAAATRRATLSIPIVMMASADPIAGGVAESLAQPGGNVTGLALAMRDVAAKRLQLIKEAVPGLSRVAAVYHAPLTPSGAEWLHENEKAAKALALDLHAVDLTQNPGQWDAHLASLMATEVGAATFFESSIFASHRQRLTALALKHRLPTVFPFRTQAEAGGLMSYGADTTDMVHRTAVYVDKILKGAKPFDLPIEQPTKFELVINLKTAKALGLTIAPSLLLRADSAIE
jgi:putative tryptophan/tyrosine transport system substrate-binding protein